MKKNNVVLITIDSLRADLLRAKEKGRHIAPNINNIAKNSYDFKNAIAPGIPTFFCFPSLMTGRLPFYDGYRLGIPSKETHTLANYFKEQGYITSAFIADNPALYSNYGYDKGFDFYFDNFSNSIVTNESRPVRINKFRKYLPKTLFDYIQSVYRSLNSPRILIPGKLLNSSIKKFFDNIKRTKHKPFFSWIHYMDVHFPYYSGISDFKNKRNPIQALLDIYHIHTNMQKYIKSMRIVDCHSKDLIIDIYKSSIKYIDSVVNDIYQFIKNKFPNTIFIITSDHGEAFMEHNFAFHEPYNLYNELIHVPLIINLPDERESKDIYNRVSLVSIPKTCSALIKNETDEFKGDNIIQKSSSPINRITKILYKCRAPHIHLGIYNNKKEISSFNVMKSFFYKSYKLITCKKDNIYELYNIKEDKLEQTNLIKNKKVHHLKNIEQSMYNTLDNL